ncbi:hypothetical protein SAMN06265377_1126 [Flagellimonas pacifica]|uniref:Uncharacterized protein n=1 Tax=Flagellimonas pacifica TaxID=1247520 RepID=A0A285MG56_9FLAO|nr:hypothetical protein SAMN06265377_1126 [Allomuricauda parva]
MEIFGFIITRYFCDILAWMYKEKDYKLGFVHLYQKAMVKLVLNYGAW